MENQNANPQGSRNQENENSIQIKDIIFLIISNWYWFVISVITCLFVSLFYLYFATPMYNVSARLLVNDEKKGGGVLGGGDVLGDIGAMRRNTILWWLHCVVR